MPSGIGRSISIALRADTKNFGKALKQTQKDLNMFKNGIRKVSMAVTAGFAVMGAAALSFAKSAVEAAIADQKSQALLAKTLDNNVKAHKALTNTVEKSVTALQSQFGVTDDELRPAFSKLIVATKNVSKSQKLMRVALDVSKGSGKKLDTVVVALSKAYQGNNTGLQRLGVGLTKAQLKTMTFDQITKKLSTTFKGAASASAQTFQGKMDRLNIKFDEFKERVGVKLIPILEKLMDYFEITVLPMIEAFANVFIGEDGANKALDENAEKAREWALKVKSLIEWIGDNTQLIKNFAKAIAGIWVVGKVSAVLAAIARLVVAYNGLALSAGRAALAEQAANNGGIASKGGKIGTFSKISGKLGPYGKAAAVVGLGYLALKNSGGPSGTSGISGVSGMKQGPIITPSKTADGTTGVKGAPTIINNFNITGAVDPDASRRAIEKVLRISSRRLGPVNLIGSSL